MNLQEARLVIGIAEALDDGRLNVEAPTVTASAVADVALGVTSRATVLDVANILDRLGVFPLGRGPNFYRRALPDLVAAVDRLRDEAQAVIDQPLELVPRS